MTKFTFNDNRDMAEMESYYIARLEAYAREIERLNDELKTYRRNNDFLVAALNARVGLDYTQ